MKLRILCSLLFFIFSCQFSGKTKLSVFDDLPVEIKNPSKQKEEEKETKCKQTGETCLEYEECKAFCEEVFFNNKGRENCYNWSYSYFSNFKTLTQQIENLSFSNLDLKTAKCFFELTKNNRIKLFKNFTEKSAELFLIQMVLNYELANYIYQSDKKEFYILKDLFYKLDRRIEIAIKTEIFSGDNFLILAQKYNNIPALNWIDNFIRDDCRRHSNCYNPLEYYCIIFQNTYREDLEDFFENRWFRTYKEDIESETCDSSYCEYGKVSDFKEFCEKI
ncbi:MAG: hypothetical protein OXC37_04815 [Bdellovibrionaceae bacterium]|nr:hypothetical protein [Pseudobdellovibrionaceae bacterium]